MTSDIERTKAPIPLAGFEPETRM